jgi:hypothetical protein
MAIKKRTSVPDPDAAPIKQEKLVIVAKPKKPIPPQSIVAGTYGPDAPGPAIRRLGLVALSLRAETPDADLTIQDRVTLMRTPFDTKNMQEQRYRNRVRNRATAITAFCITCVGGRKAVTECIDTHCPLWSFRFGSDPFYSKSKK